MKPETISDTKTRNVVILAEHDAITITHSRFSTGERGPDLHVHHEHTDAFYVLDGELTFDVGNGEVPAPAGTFVLVPPGVEHTFANRTAEPVRVLNIHAPAGFDRRLMGE